ncbi:MAG TPA: DUF4148 domain-containing protein [Trinickia sp.]|jgi:hypothetical protein|uniref:DUF4148 domain-containing protein n=1 Tax=Trinickia sp. TaxID=2571163 RepID=UPI002B83BF23|nr:DUF4148 domain-containing protein [Trinickia sp.]HTI17423.1 DUF4148 domain-containing protein [Trinickia sp.]
MKSLVFGAAVGVALLMPLASFAQAQVQSNQPLTRAQVEADLARLEQAGYRPAGQDPHYPADIQAAEARVAAQDGTAAAHTSDVGGAANEAQSGVSVSGPTYANGHSLYSGR